MTDQPRKQPESASVAADFNHVSGPLIEAEAEALAEGKVPPRSRLAGVDRRLMRLEEWSKLTDTRIAATDGRYEVLHANYSEFKGQAVTRKDLTDNRNITIGVLGLLVALVGLIFGVIVPLTVPKPTPAPQPIVLKLESQLPAMK